MPTAILVDGAFFIKRFRKIEPENAYNAQRAADLVHRWATAHLAPVIKPAGNGQAKGLRRELYRIFFYDCPPLEKKYHNPISHRSVDFALSTEAVFRKELHSQLLTKRKLALRMGHLSKDIRWTIRPEKIALMLKGKLRVDELTDDDVRIDTKQKGVDMRIGVDVDIPVLQKASRSDRSDCWRC